MKEMKTKLTHVDEQGRAKMVDVGTKDLMNRKAIAEGKLLLSSQTGEVIRKAGLPKGNPFEVARLAGIQAAKQTSQLIPPLSQLESGLGRCSDRTPGRRIPHSQ